MNTYAVVPHRSLEVAIQLSPNIVRLQRRYSPARHERTALVVARQPTHRFAPTTTVFRPRTAYRMSLREMQLPVKPACAGDPTPHRYRVIAFASAMPFVHS